MSETEAPLHDPVQQNRGAPPRRITAEQEEILALGDLTNLRDLANNAILRGTSLKDFRVEALAASEGRQKPLGLVPEAPTYGRPAAPLLRGFLGKEGRVKAPENFTGTFMRTVEGEAFPVLGPADRISTFVDPALAIDARDLGISGFVRALAFGPKTELEKRVLGGASIGSGGAMLPTPIAAELIDRLRAESVSIASGARTIPMDSATLRFARVTTDPVGTWRAENAAINDSDPVFDNLTLSAKSWGVMTRVSRELLADAPNTEMLLMDLMARVAALALDRAILIGSGTGNEPLGIRNTAGIQSVSMGTNGAQLTNWTQPLNAIQLLEDANSAAVSAMIVAPRTARAINGWVATDNQPLLPPPRVAGIPIRVTTSLPVNETQGTAVNASTAILGDFAQVFVGLRSEIELTVHPDRYADQGQVAVIAFMRADVQLARPAALARIIGIIP